MSRSTVEVDFFGVEEQSSLTTKSRAENKVLHRRRSFRDIQGVISKLNPELLKTVIESGAVNQSLIGKLNPELLKTVSESGAVNQSLIGKSSDNYCSELIAPPAPLTIFYNGGIGVFDDVPPNKAENILLELAEKGVSKAPDSKLTASSDLPIARRKSLLSFLEKRKERLALASPYPYCKTF